MKKLISLKGEGRRVLRLTESATSAAAAVSPAIEGRLWLCNEDGRLAYGELHEGRCTVAGSGFTGAVITLNGAVTHVGGFAGRETLQKRALAEIKMRSAQSASTRAKQNPRQKAEQQERSVEKQQSTQKRGEPAEAARQKSAALMEILQKAQELFTPLENERQAEERAEGETLLNPFPQAFPFSRWKRVEYPGTDSYYLEGETVKSGTVYTIYALPGEYSSRPRAKGFEKFLRSRDGSGYWIRMMRR